MYQKYEQTLKALAHDFFPCKEDAEDAIQEISIKMLGLNPPDENQDGWAYVVIMNALKDEYRKMKVRNRPVLMIEEELIDANDPYEYALTAEAALLLEENNKLLPDDVREACHLRYHHGLSYEAIAAAQGVPVGTVGSRIHRGKELLSYMLDND